MTVESQLCPQCGSAIKFAEGQTEVVCTYCGTTVTKSEVVPSLKKEIESAKVIHETLERQERLSIKGKTAPAKILTLQSTGIIMNLLDGKGLLTSFTVEVQPEGEAPFTAEAKASIGLVAIDKYQPGIILDVFYDPKDHTYVAVAGRHGVPSSNPYEQMKALMETAASGSKTASSKKIKAASDTKEDESDTEDDDVDTDDDDADNEDDGLVKVRPQTKKTQSKAAKPEEKAPTHAWGKPRQKGPVTVPPQFEPVTDLGDAAAVYRHQGSMLFAPLGKTKPKEVVLYQDGLAFHTGGKEIYTWRWPEVLSIQTHLEYYGGKSDDDYDNPKVKRDFTLLKGNGEKLVLNNDLGRNDVVRLIKPVKRAVYALLSPPLKQQYDAGQAVTFGPVTVHRKNGLAMDGKTYAWADISEVKVYHGKLRVTMNDRHQSQHQVHTSDIPNMELLFQLIDVKFYESDLWDF
jgi:ribosomal protein S27AE